MRKTARPDTQTSLAPANPCEDSSGAAESGREIMRSVLAKPRKPAADESQGPNIYSGIVIGTLAEPDEDGRPMVYYPGIPGDRPLPAILTGSPAGYQAGCEVALGFVEGNPALPIILGLIRKTAAPGQSTPLETSQTRLVDVQLDGDRLTLTADREIVLKCGKSSITLTREGKVILKGAYLSTHSTGVNRIKGGSVQIN
jgi:Domain of unknown function (DUF6484)